MDSVFQCVSSLSNTVSNTISTLVGIAIYILTAIPLMKIANSRGYKGWLAWIPIISFILILKIAGKPTWWIILLIIPIVNIIIAIIAYINFFKNIGESPLWTLAVFLLPIISPIPLWNAAGKSNSY